MTPRIHGVEISKTPFRRFHKASCDCGWSAVEKQQEALCDKIMEHIVHEAKEYFGDEGFEVPAEKAAAVRRDLSSTWDRGSDGGDAEGGA